MPAALKVVPRAATAPPKEPPSKRRKKSNQPPFLSEEEVKRFFTAIHSTRDRAIFRLMYHAGLRASEIALLDMRDYNPRTERIMVTRLKGSHSGEHHLVREASKSLRAYLRERGSGPGAIFLSQRRTGISRKMVWVLAHAYGEAAGIPARLSHPHVFKHSCATHLLTKGFNIEQVQDWLGHVNIQSTQVYAKITNARRDQMGAALRDVWK